MKKEEYNQIISKSNSVKKIYFDCFDTLIKRKYSDKYCFYKIANMLIMEFGLSLSQERLVLSLDHIFNRCNVNFDVIVRDVYIHYSHEISASFEYFYNIFRQTYINAELQNIELAENVKQLLKELAAKDLYLLSDYYLDSNILETYFITLCSYNPFKKILVSCDLKAMKEDGTLYSFVEEPEQSLMVGDNYKNDYYFAKKVGMQTVLLNADKNYARYEKFEREYVKNLNKMCFSVRDKNKKTYVSNFAFSIFLFCKKLYSNLKNDDTIWFLSRDGYFLKNCFDRFILNNNDKNISTQYLEISRLALLLPSLHDDELNPNTFKKKFKKRSQWDVHSLEEFLNYLGFSDEDKKMFDNCSNTYDDFFESKDYIDLFNNQNFITLVNKYKKETKQSFLNKIHEVKNRFIIVDLGWQGTNQNDIRDVLDKNIKLIGYYVGTTKCIGEYENSQKLGLVFDYSNIAKGLVDHFYDIEGLLKTDKGQLVSYSITGDKYLSDNGIYVYNVYSKLCQKKALEIFSKLCEIDMVTPISFAILYDIVEKIYMRKSIKSIALGSFYYNLQNSNVETRRISLHDYLHAYKMKLIINHPSVFNFLVRIKRNIRK